MNRAIIILISTYFQKHHLTVDWDVTILDNMNRFFSTVNIVNIARNILQIFQTRQIQHHGDLGNFHNFSRRPKIIFLLNCTVQYMARQLYIE